EQQHAEQYDQLDAPDRLPRQRGSADPGRRITLGLRDRLVIDDSPQQPLLREPRARQRRVLIEHALQLGAFEIAAALDEQHEADPLGLQVLADIRAADAREAA